MGWARELAVIQGTLLHFGVVVIHNRTLRVYQQRGKLSASKKQDLSGFRNVRLGYSNVPIDKVDPDNYIEGNWQEK